MLQQRIGLAPFDNGIGDLRIAAWRFGAHRSLTDDVLGTPHDVTWQELRIETFFPADAASEHALQSLIGNTKP